MEQDITNLQIDMAVINEKLDNQGKKLDSLITMVATHIENEGIKYEEINNKKADKTEVEKIQSNLSKVVWLVIIAVIGAILKLIFIP